MQRCVCLLTDVCLKTTVQGREQGNGRSQESLLFQQDYRGVIWLAQILTHYFTHKRPQCLHAPTIRH